MACLNKDLINQQMSEVDISAINSRVLNLQSLIDSAKSLGADTDALETEFGA